MRMSPTDLLDISGATYTYLINGQPPGPGSQLHRVVSPGRPGAAAFHQQLVDEHFRRAHPRSADDRRPGRGNDVEPVTVDQFRISVAETYDVIVQPNADRAYTIFVQPEDRSGYA